MEDAFLESIFPLLTSSRDSTSNLRSSAVFVTTIANLLNQFPNQTLTLVNLFDALF